MRSTMKETGNYKKPVWQPKHIISSSVVIEGNWSFFAKTETWIVNHRYRLQFDNGCLFRTILWLSVGERGPEQLWGCSIFYFWSFSICWIKFWSQFFLWRKLRKRPLQVSFLVWWTNIFPSETFSPFFVQISFSKQFSDINTIVHKFSWGVTSCVLDKSYQSNMYSWLGWW